MVIKYFLRVHRLDLLCLQETKMEAMSEGVLKSLGVSCCLEWSILEAKEAARGIMVFWDV